MNAINNRIKTINIRDVFFVDDNSYHGGGYALVTEAISCLDSELNGKK